MDDIPIIYCSKWKFSSSLIMKEECRVIYRYECDGRYYVGQTKNLHARHFQHRRKDLYIDQHIRKYNLVPIVVWIGNDSDTDDAERYFIQKFDSLYPNGFNFETGGCNHKNIHEETKEKLRRINTGVVFSEERRRKIGDTFRGKPSPKHRRPILQYDRKGYFIKEWDGMVTIQKEMNLTQTQYGMICQCCRGEFGKVFGYIWRYKESDDYPMRLDEESFNRANQQPKMILQYDINGDFIREWDNAHEPAELYGFDFHRIYAICGRNKSNKQGWLAGGYQWRYMTYEYPMKIEPYVPKTKQYQGLSEETRRKISKAVKTAYENKKKNITNDVESMKHKGKRHG